MITRRRTILLAALALAVPLPAFGLGSGADDGPELQALSVEASLAGCGVAEAAILCEIDASWSSIEGADDYTVSVTRPDGSVFDVGSAGAGAGGTSIFVPYAGNGTYSVQVVAWGTAPGSEEPKVLARESAEPTAGDGSDGAVARGEGGASADETPGETRGEAAPGDAAAGAEGEETLEGETDPCEAGKPAADPLTPEEQAELDAAWAAAEEAADAADAPGADAEAADEAVLAEQAAKELQAELMPPPAEPACP